MNALCEGTVMGLSKIQRGDIPRMILFLMTLLRFGRLG